jgi:methylmalonyl-CoA mutase, N-terminal domain
MRPIIVDLPTYNCRMSVEPPPVSRASWERDVLGRMRTPEREAAFTTISGRPIARLYTPEDLAGLDYVRDLGDPGEFPYTRGIHATGYRGKLWTMRQFAGFGTPEETNRRYTSCLPPAAPA